MAKGKGPESGRKSGRQRHGGLDELDQLLTAAGAPPDSQPEVEPKTNDTRKQKKNDSPPEVPKNQPDSSRINILRPKRRLAEWIGRIPRRPDGWFDNRPVIQETIRALHDVGLQNIQPYVKDGAHGVKLFDGREHFTLSHAQAVSLLRKSVAGFDEDKNSPQSGGDATKSSTAQNGAREVVQEGHAVKWTANVLTGIPPPQSPTAWTSSALQKEILRRTHADVDALVEQSETQLASLGMIPGEVDEDKSDEAAYFGDEKGGGELYDETQERDESVLKEEEKIAYFLHRFPHVRITPVRDGGYTIEDIRTSNDDSPIELSKSQLLNFIEREEKLAEREQDYEEDFPWFPGLFKQFKDLFPDAQITKHSFVTFTNKFGERMTGSVDDVMKIIIRYKHPGLSPEDEKSTLDAWKAEFQRTQPLKGRYTETSHNLDEATIEKQRIQSRIRAQFPDAEFSPDGAMVTMTIGEHRRQVALETALQTVEQKEVGYENKEVTTAKEISDRYLRYQDAPISPEAKASQFENGAREVQRMKYAEALRELMGEWTPDIVVQNAEYMKAELLGVLSRMKFQFTPYANSVSWAMWDIGKQYYLYRHPTESGADYTIANPLESAEKRHEILCRHLGWEFHAAYYFKRLPQNLLDLIESHPDIKAIITKEVKQENSSLSSFDLAELGRKLYGIYQGGGPGGEPPNPPSVDGGTPADRERRESAEQLQTLRAHIAYLEKAKADDTIGTRAFAQEMERRGLTDPEFIQRRVNDPQDGSIGAYNHMWVVRQIDALRQQAKELESRVDTFFDARFRTEFGISKENLETLPGYTNLTEGQKVLLFENLDDYAKQGNGTMKHAWSGFMSQFGVKHDGPPKKGTLGFGAYKKVLQLRMHALRGLSVHVENGKALPDFVGIRLGNDEHRGQRKKAADALNAAAHAFAGIPASWQEGTASMPINSFPPILRGLAKINSVVRDQFFGKPHKDTYLEQRQAYERAKAVFAESMAATGVPQDAVIRALHTVDNNVHLSRFIETNAEAVAKLEEEIDPLTAEKIGASILGTGAYVALGIFSKQVGAGISTYVGGPIAAAILAGTKEWNKKAALQRESDRQRMLGHPEDNAEYMRLVREVHEAHKSGSESSGYKAAVFSLRAYENRSSSLNTVSASALIGEGERKIDRGITAKLHDAIREYERYRTNDELYESGPLGARVKLKKSDRSFENLLARIQYAEDKLNLNRVQFGDATQYALNRQAFMRALEEAKVVVALHTIEGTPSERSERLLKKLSAKLGRKETRIQEARIDERLKAVTNWQTKKAILLASLGVTAESMGWLDALGTKIGSTDWFKNTFPSWGEYRDARALEQALQEGNELGINRGPNGTVYQEGIPQVSLSSERVVPEVGLPSPDGVSGPGGEVSPGTTTPSPESATPSYEGGREEFVVGTESITEAPTSTVTPVPERVAPTPSAPPSPSELLSLRYKEADQLLGQLVQSQFEPARWSDLKVMHASELAFDRLGSSGPQFDAGRERVAGLVQQMSARYGRPPLETESVEAYLGRIFRSEATTPKGLNSLVQYVRIQGGK